MGRHKTPAADPAKTTMTITPAAGGLPITLGIEGDSMKIEALGMTVGLTLDPAGARTVADAFTAYATALEAIEAAAAKVAKARRPR